MEVVELLALPMVLPALKLVVNAAAESACVRRKARRYRNFMLMLLAREIE